MSKKIGLLVLIVFIISVIFWGGYSILREVPETPENEVNNEFNTESTESGEELTNEEIDVLAHRISDTYVLERGMNSMNQFRINLESGDFEFDINDVTYKVSKKEDTVLLTSENLNKEIVNYYYPSISKLYIIDLDESDDYKEICIKTTLGIDGNRLEIYRLADSGVDKIYDEDIYVESFFIEYINDKFIIQPVALKEDYDVNSLFEEAIIIGYEIYENGEFVKEDRFLTGEKYNGEMLWPEALQNTIFTISGGTFYELDNNTRCVIDGGSKIKVIAYNNVNGGFYKGNHTVELVEDMSVKVYELNGKQYEFKEEKIIESGAILENIRCSYRGDGMILYSNKNIEIYGSVK